MAGNEGSDDKLSNEEIARYSRQIILPEFGMKGQQRLKNGSVLVVGLGGLGSPASLYLATAGIGRLGLVDYDVVEVSNLHRQVIHSEKTVGVAKALSAQISLVEKNSHVKVEVYKEAFTTSNAVEIIKNYDVVLDCTDNAATRYLLNDACVICKKPLVSGSALRFEGQLITYNYENGPCYRCIYPVPPPPEFVTNCSDGGVFPPIPGMIGTMQALEAIKLISGIGPSYVEKMFTFDALDGTPRVIKMRSKVPSCAVCGDSPKITALLEDYPAFCGSGYDDKEKGVDLLSTSERITPKQYSEIKKSYSNHILIDVREPQELEICSLSDVSKNIPYSKMNSELIMASLGEYLVEKRIESKSEDKLPVYVVCRRGNDSQRAVKLLQSKFSGLSLDFKDIQGGLHKWAEDVDRDFPVY